MTLADNVRNLRERVAKACAAAGRNEREITVVAATKTVPAEIAETLAQYGIMHAGENRVQEFTQKYRADSPLNWHMIGALQTNKVKYVVGKVRLIQSVDRIPLAQEINRISKIRGVITDVLAEVNVGGEESKSGVLPAMLDELCAQIVELPNVRLCGLMSIPPIGAPTAMYERMEKLSDEIKAQYKGADTLSMGMSNDYETAIACGATMIRPGRALFGERAQKTQEEIKP